MKARRESRSDSGIVGICLMTVFIPIVMAVVGVLSFDLPYMIAVHSQLQSATDAAALAGAKELTNNTAGADTAARMIAGANQANGFTIATDSQHGTTIDVQVVPPSFMTRGTVTVTATVPVKHAFSAMFGRTTDSVRAVSVAGSMGSLDSVNPNQMFPLAIASSALTQSTFGPTTFWIESQQGKNAAFTSFSNTANNPNIDAAISQALGLTAPVPGVIPALSVGDSVNLSNGITGQKQLMDEPYYSALINSPACPVPVVSTGSGPMNQTGTVIGFLAIKITGVLTDNQGKVLGFQANIINGSFEGQSDGTANNTTGSQVIAGRVQLL